MTLPYTPLRFYAVILTGVVVIGATIFTLNMIDNPRKRLYAVTLIELQQGDLERYETAKVAGGSPYVIKTYTINGTNYKLTNAIGFFSETGLINMVQNDIRAIIPYYVNTNSLIDGYSNVVNWTVTGLWAHLGIGDGTNQFTRVPAWTNAPTTNWLICYTSYYPQGTSTVVVCYTADTEQAVSYATNYDGTNFTWGVISNWSQVVVTRTNAAVYGNTGPRVYEITLREMYRALSACSVITQPVVWAGGSNTSGESDWFTSGGVIPPFTSVWYSAKTQAVSRFGTMVANTPGLAPEYATMGYSYSNVLYYFIARGQRRFSYATLNWPKYSATPWSALSNVVKSADLYLRGTKNTNFFWTGAGQWVRTGTYESADSVVEGSITLFASPLFDSTGGVAIAVGDTNLAFPPTWVDQPVVGEQPRSLGYKIDKAFWLVKPSFTYCTNNIN